MDFMTILFGAGGFAVFFVVLTFVALLLRRVVPTNEVHIVQSAKKTTSYGKDTNNGNTYYEWPSWIPFIGIMKSKFQTSVFTLKLDGYEAYDKGRLPFMVDVAAFFRISDSNVAAQRVASFAELLEQLHNVVQGAIRSILASHDIEEILQGRSTFGEQFTKEVEKQLASWGVETVKNIELMDIRDSNSSVVIKNIMEKKKSHIEMESRTEVAKNKKIAQVAEIEAQKEVDLQKQDASQSVGLRTIEAQRQVDLQNQAKIQQIKEQEKVTKEKEMNILQVQQLRTAEIERGVQVVKAEQNRQTSVINAETQKQTAVVMAEGEKTKTVLTAEGWLESKKKESEGIALEGQAKADAEKAMQLAPVQAQITLAKEIGENQSYQQYLITIRKVEADQAVGMEQAKALSNADIKVISNTGTPAAGLNGVMDLFTSQGGTAVGSMLEGLANTETGQKLIDKVVGTEKKTLKSNGSASLSNGLNK